MSDWNDYGDDYGDEHKNYWDDEDSDDQWESELRPDFRDQYKDTERAGGQVIGCWEMGIDGQPLKTQTPLGRFCLKVDAVSRNINSTCKGFSISDEQIQKLLNKSQELHRVEFKNPTAFVLGYLATSRGNRAIDKTSLNNVWICYESTSEYDRDSSIKKPDIIRYARLWVN